MAKIQITLTNDDGSVVTVTAPTVSVVTQPPPPQAPSIPSNATVIDMLQPPSAWKYNHDPGTPGGTDHDSTNYPATAPDGTPNCRLFQFNGSGGGGEIFHTVAIPNIDDTMFNTVCYETEELLPNINEINNYEKDVELTDADGTVHDMATQVASNILEITGNAHWIKSGILVPARKANVWMRTRRFVRYNGDGTVTYIGYEQDGVYYPVGITEHQVGGSKWAGKILNVQLQYDSVGNASGIQVFIRVFKITVYKS